MKPLAWSVLLLVSGVWLGGVNRSALGAQEQEGEGEKVEPGDGDSVFPFPDPITPTRRPGRWLVAPTSVTVLTAAEIRASGARFLTDILRMIPGLEVQRLSATESAVSARGYNDDSSAAQGMMCLIDGRLVNHEFMGAVLWDTLPVNLDEIERIEVIRGPGTFLYGPSAMHGFVNIVTKGASKRTGLRNPDGEVVAYRVRTEDEISVAGQVGSYRSSVARVTVSRRELQDAVRISLAQDDINEFARRSRNAKDKRFFEVVYERWFGEADKAKVYAAHVPRLTLAGGMVAQEFDLLIPSFGGVPTDLFVTDSTDGHVRAQFRAGKLIGNDEFKVNGSWTRRRSSTVSGSIYGGFDLNLDEADIDAQYVIKDPLNLEPGTREPNALTVGAGYRAAAFETTDPDIALGRHRTGLAWVFLQADTEVFERVFVTGGVRLDRHSVAGSLVSPRLAVVWEFDPHAPPKPGETLRAYTLRNRNSIAQSLRTSFGVGSRSPSLRELWFDLPLSVPGVPLPVKVIGNRDLDFERIRSVEAGYRLEWWKRGQIGVTAYYNRIDDLVEFAQVQLFPEVLYGPVNIDREEAFGIEVEGKATAFRWGSAEDGEGEVGVFAGYAYGIRRNRDTRDLNRLAPRHKGSAGIRVTKSRFGGMAWVHFVDDTELRDPASGGTFIGKADEYAILNGRLSYGFENGPTVFIQAMNLLDDDHREHPIGEEYGLILTAGFEMAW